jgi:hypothetical protein
METIDDKNMETIDDKNMETFGNNETNCIIEENVKMCNNVYLHYQKLHPILTNVKLACSKYYVINGIEVAGATNFKGNILEKIHVSTYVCKKIPRSLKDMIFILLHEIAHALTYTEHKTETYAPPTYIIDSNQTSKNKRAKDYISQNKIDRKRNKYRNHIDSHHPPNFWNKYVELVKIAVENDFVKISKKSDSINVDFVKKIDSSY